MENSNGFIIPVTLTEEDFFIFQFQFSKRPLIFSFAIIIITFLMFSGNLLQNTLLIILMLAMMLLLPLLLYRSIKKESKKQFYSNTMLQKNIDYEFSEEGIRITAENGTSYLLWNEVFTMVEQKGGFVLFQSNRLGNYIPKSSIKDDWHLQEIKRLIQKAPKRKRNFVGQYK